MASISWKYLLYNVFFSLAWIIFLPYFVIRNLFLKRPIFVYFNNLSATFLEQLDERPVIWVQAVSVGETVVANCIVNELQTVLPDYQVVFTTTTPTGQAMALKLLENKAAITYFPFDLPCLVNRFIKRIKPRVFVMTETEIWPNAIRYAQKAGVKTVIVNGRISDKSYQRYLKIKGFLKEVLGQVDLLAMQSTEDANRIGRLGAPLAKIMVTGNAKFDLEYQQISHEQLESFRRQYGWDKIVPIFTAASTHHGEEEQVIEAFQSLLKQGQYYLILGPRHPDRAEEVAGLLKTAGLNYVKRTDPEFPISLTPQVLLLDTFGEFGLAYAAAEVVFVGGSLVDIGGHNILEAAVQAKPVIYGPFMHNFRESKQLLEEADAGFSVQNSVELVKQIRELTSDPALYMRRAENAKKAVLANKGAAKNTAILISELLKG